MLYKYIQFACEDQVNNSDLLPYQDIFYEQEPKYIIVIN